jgi:superfamily II DNA/RNA helicase
VRPWTVLVATLDTYDLSFYKFHYFLASALSQAIDINALTTIKTQHLHRVLPHIYQKFIRAPKVGRIEYLSDIIEADVDKKRKVLIFCNKASTSAFVSHWLREQLGIQGVPQDAFSTIVK